jgi:hypothetical protein
MSKYSGVAISTFRGSVRSFKSESIKSISEEVKIRFMIAKVLQASGL